MSLWSWAECAEAGKDRRAAQLAVRALLCLGMPFRVASMPSELLRCLSENCWRFLWLFGHSKCCYGWECCCCVLEGCFSFLCYWSKSCVPKICCTAQHTLSFLWACLHPSISMDCCVSVDLIPPATVVTYLEFYDPVRVSCRLPLGQHPLAGRGVVFARPGRDAIVWRIVFRW